MRTGRDGGRRWPRKALDRRAFALDGWVPGAAGVVQSGELVGSCPMKGVWAWSRARIRRRMVQLAAIGLVAGIAGAATLTAIAGARRTASVLDRHIVAQAIPDVTVGPDFDPAYYRTGVLDPYYDLDGVDAHTEVYLLAMRPIGADFGFFLDRSVVAPTDNLFAVEMDRLRVIEGRLFDHATDDEVVLSEDYADAIGVGVGDIVQFESLTRAQVATGFTNNFRFGSPEGPTVGLTVVGISREFEPFVDVQTLPGSAYLPAGFTRRWGEVIGAIYMAGAVRLEEGATFESYRQSALAASLDVGVGLEVQPVDPNASQVRGAVDAQVLALLVFAGVVAAAGAAVTFAALSRELSSARDDQLALRAVGMSRSHRLVAIALVGVPAGLLASAVSVTLALGGSTLLPISTPRRIEPDPGIRADAVVLAVGGVSVAVAVVALATAVGVAVARLTPRRSPVAGTGAVGSITRRITVSAPAMIGVRFALRNGRGDQGAPTRSTLVGCAIGVVGLVAATSFASSLDHLASTPRLYGNAADAMLATEGEAQAWQAGARRLESDSDIAELATVIATTLVVDEQSIGAAVFDLRKGDPFNAIVEGRAPAAGDELTVGAKVADLLEVGVGDQVMVGLADGRSAPYTVVGIAAHPDEFEDYRSGIALLGDSTDPFLTGDEGPGMILMVRFAEGVDPHEVVRRYTDEGMIGVVGARTPREVDNLEEVRVFPRMLALVLVVLASVFLLHSLTVGTLRRSRELAVLRAIGFTTRQLRMVLQWQAATIALGSLAVGIPLGVGVGRLAWTQVADRLGVVVEHHLAWVWLPLWAVAVVGYSSLLAFGSGYLVLRGRPATALRAPSE